MFVTIKCATSKWNYELLWGLLGLKATVVNLSYRIHCRLFSSFHSKS